MRFDEVELSCQGCTLREQPRIDDGSVYVRVPVEVSGCRYWATLRCRVGEEAHEIALEMLTDEQGGAVAISAELERRLSGALERVAELRLCGNERLCPEAVVLRLGERR